MNVLLEFAYQVHWTWLTTWGTWCRGWWEKTAGGQNEAGVPMESKRKQCHRTARTEFLKVYFLGPTELLLRTFWFCLTDQRWQVTFQFKLTWKITKKEEACTTNSQAFHNPGNSCGSYKGLDLPLVPWYSEIKAKLCP